MRSIKVILSNDERKFENQVNELLSHGYNIESTSCGFADSEKYDYCGIYQAILSITKEDGE